MWRATLQMIDGIDDFLKDLKKISDGNEKELGKLLAQASFETHGEAVRNISSGGRSGKVYKRGSVSHQASAAGEFPKTDTGELVRNITIERQSNLSYTVGSRQGAPHGYYLEMKSPLKGGRKWLQPSFDKVVRNFKP